MKNTFTTSRSTSVNIILFLIAIFCGMNVIYARPVNILSTAVHDVKKRSEHLKGKGTYYDVMGVGSCGFDADDDEGQLVVALSKDIMSQGSYCGKYITFTSENGSVDLKVIDTCPGCERGDVDMSKAAFDEIGDYEKGHVEVTWTL